MPPFSNEGYTREEEFIRLVTPEAIKACRESNFKIVSSLIAQSALESGWLKSSLAYKYNNLLGRKWATNNVITKDYVVLETKEWKNGKYITVYSKFCIYKSIAECFKDYIWLLNNVKKGGKLRYQRVLDCKDYICATDMISKCGYATSPTYTQSLRNIITKYNLDKFDI
ncbi:MAG: glucosaminidase domain-containing protein [Atribacterota bacterium]|nr:glucosaminidase domain-containing protein [Atribacterota bacterium]